MPKSTDDVYVVLWDISGYGPDCVLGVFWDEYVALKEIEDAIVKYGKRYVRADFVIQGRKVL